MDKHTNLGDGGSELIEKHVKRKYGKTEIDTGGETKAAMQSSSLACIKFWIVVISTILVILWVFSMQLATFDDKIMVPKSAFYFPFQGDYKNNGYLMITPDGGLNQKRLGISDMVVIARFLNVTLIVPKASKDTYWNDTSEFSDIFDVNHFITSLRDEVKILKELPPEQKRKAESEALYYMFPMPYGSLQYYYQKVLPRIQKREILLFALIDARLANNGLPKDLQLFRCRVNYEALRFTQMIEETGRKIVNSLREKGPYLVLHLRYEKDMLAFTGCIQGLTKEEAVGIEQLRYGHEGWKHKPIYHWKKKRQRGLCPLTPEETALVLQALGIDRNTTIYIAAGEIYNKEKSMANLTAAYPNMVSKQTILKPEELQPFLEHADKMAALDYIVAVESDIFLHTFVGNMEKAVLGHRRYLGFKPTISLDRKVLVGLIDQYKNGTLMWDEFSLLVEKVHENRRGQPVKRRENPDHPSQEDKFYSNPQECLPTFASTFN